MTNNNQPKWYIATTIIGNEDMVYKNVEDKIRAYGLNDFVKEIKLLKTNEVTIEIFDNKTNPPPKVMRDSKTIKWETLPGNKYKKTRIREVNKFPGYIYIQMIMTEEVWYAIRNTYGITGFVGSSGKGAQPIPMSDSEVELLFNPEFNHDIIINKTDGTYTEVESSNNLETQNHSQNEPTVEFLDTPEIISVSNKPFIIEDDYFDSSRIQDDNAIDEIKEDASPTTIENLYLMDDNDNDDIKSSTKSTKINDRVVKVGTYLKIINGPMIDSVGHITEINEEEKKYKVEIEVLGKKTNVTINFDDASFDDIDIK